MTVSNAPEPTSAHPQKTARDHGAHSGVHAPAVAAAAAEHRAPRQLGLALTTSRVSPMVMATKHNPSSAPRMARGPPYGCGNGNDDGGAAAAAAATMAIPIKQIIAHAIGPFRGPSPASRRPPIVDAPESAQKGPRSLASLRKNPSLTFFCALAAVDFFSFRPLLRRVLSVPAPKESGSPSDGMAPRPTTNGRAIRRRAVSQQGNQRRSALANHETADAPR